MLEFHAWELGPERLSLLSVTWGRGDMESEKPPRVEADAPEAQVA